MPEEVKRTCTLHASALSDVFLNGCAFVVMHFFPELPKCGISWFLEAKPQKKNYYLTYSQSKVRTKGQDHHGQGGSLLSNL